MKFSIENARKIKLIIWDLDETFWKGTLSDNDITLEPIQMNIDFVKRMADRGIINAVCSKNDRDVAEKKLDELGVKDFFVFNSINWEAKGVRIQNTLLSMALRPNNVLFLDDNLTNLAEAEYVMPELMVSTPDVIPKLYSIVEQLGKNDINHSRLQQYKMLEKKRTDAKGFGSNIDFLMQSNIKIQFSELDDAAIPRIAELIQRSNQLNFTKKRIDENELRILSCNIDYVLGYVSVSDSYGKYGIVGFYALNKVNNQLEHFLFSCRTMGMGIEQYVYATLGYPNLFVIEPVSGSVSKEAGMPEYISRVDKLGDEEYKLLNAANSQLKVLLKGPCDLEVMASYLEADNVTLDKEFNFVDCNGNQADYFNHLENILNLDADIINDWCSKYSFLSKEGFQTKLFSGEYDIVCLSPLMDATLAVYDDGRNHHIAYGLYSKPLSQLKNHKLYINKQIMTARSNFNEDELLRFSEEFKQINYSPEMVADNLAMVIERIYEKKESTKVVVLLMGELEYKSNASEYLDTFANKHKIHKSINDHIRNKFRGNSSVYLLDVNKYIKSQIDYFDNINHYSKYVYFKMAQEFVEYIGRTSSVQLTTSSRAKMIIQNLKRSIYKKLFVK